MTDIIILFLAMIIPIVSVCTLFEGSYTGIEYKVSQKKSVSTYRQFLNYEPLKEFAGGTNSRHD